MQIRGTIKGVKAAMSASRDITQQLVIEFFDDAALSELRGMMEEPVLVKIEAMQAKFGQNAERGAEK